MKEVKTSCLTSFSIKPDEEIKMKKNLISAVLGASLSLAAVSAYATHTVYFGEDLGAGEGTRLTSHPNADAARASFFSQLVGVGTESLEGFADETSGPLAISFPGFGTATLGGTGYVNSVPTGTNGVGRYPISGDNYWEGSGTFVINFSAPVAAFGFYGIDIGDYGGQVTATLSGGSTEVYNIPNTMYGSGGGVLYWGIIDTVDTFTSLTFGNTAGGTDYFGFDDFSVGGVGQVHVPEPASLALMAIGLAGLAGLRRRKNYPVA
jgi:hypothetical protein